MAYYKTANGVGHSDVIPTGATEISEDQIDAAIEEMEDAAEKAWADSTAPMIEAQKAVQADALVALTGLGLTAAQAEAIAGPSSAKVNQGRK